MHENVHVGKTPETTRGIRFDPELLATIREQAHSEDRSLNWTVQALIKEGLRVKRSPASSPALSDPVGSVLEIGPERVYASPCVAVEVSAGKGSPWKFYPSGKERNYFYRMSFVRRALDIPVGAPDPPLGRLVTVLMDRDVENASSMAPTIQAGAALLVDKTLLDPKKLPERAICLVNVAPEGKEQRYAVRRVTILDHVVVFESDNPDPKYAPKARLTTAKTNWGELIIGRVLEWSTQA